MGNLADNTRMVAQLPIQNRGAINQLGDWEMKQTFRKVQPTVATEDLFSELGYNEQSSGAQRSIVSDSANDSDPAGTGARKVYIAFIDGNGDEGSEEIALNGVTPVDTVSTDIMHVNRMIISEAGSLGVSAGEILLKARTAGAGVTIDGIKAADLQMQTAQFFVPNGKILLLDDFYYSSGGTASDFIFKMSQLLPNGKVIFGEVFRNATNLFNAGSLKGFSALIPQNGKFQVHLNVTAGDINKFFYVLMRGWLKTNPFV